MTQQAQEAPVKVKAQMGATGFTPQEAALHLKEAGVAITAKQIRRALRKGTLPAKQLSGRWYITRKDLNKFGKAKEAKSKES